MDSDDFIDLFRTPGARWFERLDRSWTLMALLAVGAIVAWAVGTETTQALVIAVVATGVAIGSVAGGFLLRELYHERCQTLVQERLDALETGLLAAIMRAPELTDRCRAQARKILLTRLGGRALLLT